MELIVLYKRSTSKCIISVIVNMRYIFKNNELNLNRIWSSQGGGVFIVDRLPMGIG